VTWLGESPTAFNSPRMVTASTADAVEDAFGAGIDYAMLVKLYGVSNESPESRYSPATCIGCRTGVLAGNPDHHISTSFVEAGCGWLRCGICRRSLVNPAKQLGDGRAERFSERVEVPMVRFFSPRSTAPM
jgi:hypothetical protein